MNRIRAVLVGVAAGLSLYVGIDLAGIDLARDYPQVQTVVERVVVEVPAAEAAPVKVQYPAAPKWIKALIAETWPAHARRMAECVAWHESRYTPRAVSPTGDYGLWQINKATWDRTFTWSRIFEPRYNARAAYRISRGGRSWTPWTVYRMGLC